MMNKHLRISFLVLFLFGLILLLQPVNLFGFQTNKTDFEELRKLLTEAVKEDFEIVKDIRNNQQIDTQGYWLVHLKPKRAGHFALKYSFKYTHKLSHPEEGEHELYIRVGDKNCTRHNNNNRGLGNVCLGDTIIVPFLVNYATGHQFRLKSTYQDAETIGKGGQFFSTPAFTSTEPVNNPLEEHLKYLGTVRSVMPNRACCSQTVVYTAYFEAKSVGRFNLAVSTSLGDESADRQIKLNPLDGMPILIINPGTPITGLVYVENTIDYSDNKRFSGHSGNNFMTNLLILQPGDMFAIEYASRVEREDFEKKLPLVKKSDKPYEPKILIRKLPFTVDKDWSYNGWLIDYLPKESK